MGFGLVFISFLRSPDLLIRIPSHVCWGKYTTTKTTNRSGSLGIDSIDKNRCRLIPVAGLFTGVAGLLVGLELAEVLWGVECSERSMSIASESEFG